jgi:hypothetical protein
MYFHDRATVIHDNPSPCRLRGYGKDFGALAFLSFPSPFSDEKKYSSAAHLYLFGDGICNCFYSIKFPAEWQLLSSSASNGLSFRLADPKLILI